MKAKRRTALIVLLLSFCVTVIAGPKPDIREVIFDPERFVSALGKNVLIVDTAENHNSTLFGEKVTLLRKIIQDSKRDPKPSLFVFPDDGTPPKIAGARSVPVYPKDLKERGIGGVEKYLLMLSPEGKVAALYCYEKDNPDLAANGALAIARWKFSPAKIGTQPVPVVAFFELSFAPER